MAIDPDKTPVPEGELPSPLDVYRRVVRLEADMRRGLDEIKQLRKSFEGQREEHLDLVARVDNHREELDELSDAQKAAATANNLLWQGVDRKLDAIAAHIGAKVTP